MAGIYVYSDQAGLAAELLGLARQSGKESAVISADEQEAAALARYGADKVYLLQAQDGMIENYGQAVAELLKNNQADLFAVGATARGRDLAARVAGYLDCAMVSDVVSVHHAEGRTTTERMLYGGAIVQMGTINGLGVITVPAGKFSADIAVETSEIIKIPVEVDGRVRLVKREALEKQGVDLCGADKVLCIGLGLEKQADLELAQELAAALQAELGCTRGIAEERHWLPVEQYIGISGAVIKPQLYISLGVSGQVQHIFGIRDAKIIVGIDSNEKAPIFRAADYGLVGDLYEIVPLLTEALRNMA